MGSPTGQVPGARRRITRREFMKWSAAAAGVGAIGALAGASALGYVKGPQEPKPEWEIGSGQVDYRDVPESLSGPDPNTLKVAQWYDYWPGSFLKDFKDYMKKKFKLNVEVQWDVFTSNEELFYLITLSKRKYDVMVPTNYYTDLYKRAGMIYNLNKEWLPNLANINHELVDRPTDNPWNYRGGLNGDLVAMPYFWGTTGVGFRKDKISKEQAQALGYDIFTHDNLTVIDGGSLDLVKKMRMLDEMNDVFTAGFKMAGWDWQRKQGMTPTGLFPPAGPQWTSSEGAPERVMACGDWLMSVRPRLFDYNSVDVIPSLINGTSYVNQAWNGDMVYAIRPDQNTPLPVDYVLPYQGSTIWFDSVCIHNQSRNLWLAHQFINFIHDKDQNVRLTKWNMYATPNQACYEALQERSNWYQNGYKMWLDPMLYPNVVAPESLRVCDISRYANLDTILNLYNPLWFDLTTE